MDAVGETVVAPTITSQPQSEAVTLGGSAGFSVSASGSPPLTYQWYFNDTGHPVGGNSPTLSLNNVQTSDAGGYFVVVTNPAGYAQSQMATLTVASQPGCDTTPGNVVGWWPGDMDTSDLSGNADGVLKGGAVFGQGMVAQAFDLYGSGQYVLIPDTPATRVSNAATFEAWVYPTTSSGQNVIIGKWDVVQGVNTRSFGFVLDTGPVLGFGFSQDGGPDNCFGLDAPADKALPLYTWSHVAATYDGSYVALYLNGNWVSGLSYSGHIYPAATDFAIGAVMGGDASHPLSCFQGNIDEATVYNRALSAKEIQDIYKAGAAGKCKPVIDSDADGLPDSWEMQYFGNLNQTASGDPDGDGYTNLEEYQNGTNPTVPDPLAIVLEPEPGGNIP